MLRGGAFSCRLCALAGVVGIESTGEVLRMACIIGTVGAFEYVGEPVHGLKNGRLDTKEQETMRYLHDPALVLTSSP